MNVGYPKQYLPLAGKPMLRHVLDTFASHGALTHTYVVVSPEDSYIDEIIEAAPHLSEKITVLRIGGATRRDSVLNGLLAVAKVVSANDWVMVHDAARPGLSHALIDRLIQELREDDVGGLLAIPVADTIKRSTQDRRSMATVPREDLWAAQTPQMFRYATLVQALETNVNVTDEASAIEKLGLQPRLIEGSLRNSKITLPGDITLAEYYLKEKP